ncbi:hypothetical protein [Thermovibrio sp.]
MNKELKAFLIYAYAFIFLYMLNSLLLWFFLKLRLPSLFTTAVESLTMILGLFFAYTKIAEKYFNVSDKKKITVGWLWQFIPFVIASAVLLFLSFSLLRGAPSLAVFLYLNLDIVALYFTFKFSLRKLKDG